MLNLRNRQNGMTLLELMVVIAIGSIVVMMAIPSFSKMNAHLNVTGAAQALVMDLRTTQANAIRQGTTTTLSYGSTQQSYQDFCNVNSCLPVDGGNNPYLSVSFDSSGYLTDPAALPWTVTLQSAQTGESVKVRVLRTGRICTFPGAGAATC